jgi:hypothetical protein
VEDCLLMEYSYVRPSLGGCIRASVCDWESGTRVSTFYYLPFSFCDLLLGVVITKKKSKTENNIFFRFKLVEK